MAATVSSPWGKPGAWALEAEEHEAELQQQDIPNNNNKSSEDVSDFPSLAAAAATKQPKKKKNQTLSLSEFATYSSKQESKGLTHEELLSLPTAPRQRSADELDRNRLGGAFKNYGMGRNGEDSNNSRWGGGAGGGNSRVSNRDSSREIMPSRADEVDDWSKTKKSPVGNGYERRERGSFFESHSKADESDNWVSNKPADTRRFGASNGGFERRGSFDSLSRERNSSNNTTGGADSDTWGRRREESNGTGGGARPKLVLQPRTLPSSNNNGAVAKPKGSNPFGDARPREEVLAEKGMDHKEIDEKLDSLKINNGNGNNREVEKGKRDVGSRWSFGSFGSEPGRERTWRKPDVVADSDSRPQSAGKTEDGDHGSADENGIATENEHTEGN